MALTMWCTLLVGAYLLFKLLSFIYYYILALRTGFTIFATPIFTESVIWMVLGPMLRPKFEKYLPTWMYMRLDLVIAGWDFRRRFDIRQVVGDTSVFVIVSPDGCSLW